MSFTNNTLYRINTVDEFEGTESFALIDPKKVTSITPATADVGFDTKARTITGSRVIISMDEAFFVPDSPSNVARMLDINEKETVHAQAA
jgi:hypothetical protein